MKQLFVIQEDDSTVIGVASNKERSKEMILEYFGEYSSEITEFKDVRDSGIEFTCNVFVKEDDGYNYGVTVYYFNFDEI